MAEPPRLVHVDQRLTSVEEVVRYESLAYEPLRDQFPGQREGTAGFVRLTPRNDRRRIEIGYAQGGTG